MTQVKCLTTFPDQDTLASTKLWLEEDGDRFVVILSDDLRATGHDRIRVCPKEDTERAMEIAKELVFLEFEFPDDEAVLPLASAVETVHLLSSDYKERGLDLFKNFIKNAPLIDKAKDGSELFGKCKGVPAVICGAGPSLDTENLPAGALVFAGGNAMQKVDKPHFGAAIDPHPPLFHYGGDYPLFFQSRVHTHKIANYKGPLLWMPGSESDFFDNGHFDGGWNVACFLVQIALHMGCNPIILNGVDLVHEDGTTQSDWVKAGRWLDQLIERHPQVRWMSTSKGDQLKGLTFPPLQPIDLPTKRAPSHDVGAISSSLERVGDLASNMLGHLEKIFPTPPHKSGEYRVMEAEMEGEMAFDLFLRPVWEVWRPVFARQVPQSIIPKGYGIDLNKWLFIKGICDDARTK